MLRKKPPGRLLSASAHKVEREYRAIAALYRHGTGVPVPRPYALCEDPAVLGTPFYLMEFLDGRIIEDPYMRSLGDDHGGRGGGVGGGGGGGGGGDIAPAERRALWRAAVETLARLHAVDRAAVGLASFGSGGGTGSGSGGRARDRGFYARQVATWRRICEAQARAVDVETGEAVGPVPHSEELLAFFGDERRPGRPRDGGGGGGGSLVHGDYKIDNLVFHPAEPRVIGILDWEMSTAGHPLSDLANLLLPLYGAGPGIVSAPAPAPALTDARRKEKKEKKENGGDDGDDPTRTPGLPDPAAVVAWYGAAAGRPVRPREMAWALAFGVFRLAAICQGIAARVATRQASSASARRHAAAMAPLADMAWAMVRREIELEEAGGKEDEEEGGGGEGGGGAGRGREGKEQEDEEDEEDEEDKGGKESPGRRNKGGVGAKL